MAPNPKIKFSLENLQNAARNRPRALPYQRDIAGNLLGFGEVSSLDVPQLPSFASAGATNPEAPVMPPPAPVPGVGARPVASGQYDDLWTRTLALAGQGAASSNPEAARDWGEGGYRKRRRGMELLGVAPQAIYWQNLEGSGQENLTNNTLVRPEDIWGAYAGGQYSGNYYYGDWFNQDMRMLESVWPSLSDDEQQIWRDQLLYGTGLPSYLVPNVKARPQELTDYISRTFVV